MAIVGRGLQRRRDLATYFQKLQEGGYSFLDHERLNPSMDVA